MHGIYPYGMLRNMPTKISLYIHIPFCRHRCAYCDFNTYAGQENLIPAYLKALQAEIEQVAAKLRFSFEIGTIFLGGGTPSYLPVEGLQEILETCRKAFWISEDCEISLEANPGTVNRDGLSQLRRAGFNRISMGMQSANINELRLLEREHDPIAVIHATESARLAGFKNLNLDLIFGIPGQTMDTWKQSIHFALGLKPDHLSLYALTIEHGTPFKRWVERGFISSPDDDLAADQYEYACQVLEEAGFDHYEISNWALKSNNQSMVCLHNLQYWRYQPYIGVGAGAHGFLENHRTINVRGIKAYIDRMMLAMEMPYPASSAADQVIELDLWTQMQEKMMVGLRLLKEGVEADPFAQKFGFEMEEVFGERISKLTGQGLLEWTGSSNQRRLRLTRRAWLLGNRVFREFVGLPEPAVLRKKIHSTTTRVP